MISTANPLTLSLALATGLYVLAGGTAMLRLGDKAEALLADFQNSPALTYIAGIMTFAIGVAIILTHNIWSDGLAIFVSLLGWVAAIEGLVLIAWPEPLWALGRAMMKPTAIKFFSFGMLALGALLSLLGLTGTAG